MEIEDHRNPRRRRGRRLPEGEGATGVVRGGVERADPAARTSDPVMARAEGVSGAMAGAAGRRGVRAAAASGGGARACAGPRWAPRAAAKWARARLTCRCLVG